MTDTTEFDGVQTDAPEAGISGENFSMTDLPEALCAAAARMNWTDLMPVQRQAIPPMVGGQDIMVQSQTGSGKTGAFLLPILNRIDPALGAPQAMVLAPTRELAVQVSRDAEELGREVGIRSLAIYGGVGYKPQIQGLEAGAQLIIGTPGRILDHLLKGTLNLDRLKILVFDEADRMLSMGFYPDMKQLQRYLPRGLQSAMFSATYPGHVKRLAQQFLKDPLFVSLSQEQVHASDVLHVVYKVPAMQKSRILVKIIEQENPASGIIFCNTKADVHFVAVVLRRFGYDVGEISADLSQGAREEVLDKLRRNKLKFLVATDVAARGIDIHELSHVFQYQPPQDHEAYVHRTGRTGRAGAAGVAISFVSGMEEIELEQISKKFSINLEERQVPTDEELETLISQRAVFLLEAQLRKADSIQKERMQRFMRIVTEVAANEESRAVLAMLMDEFYQKTFHAPLEQPSDRLIEPARFQAPTEPRQDRDRPVLDAQPGPREEGLRPEGEKRRRKRSRKKPGSTAQGASETVLEDFESGPELSTPRASVVPVSPAPSSGAGAEETPAVLSAPLPRVAIKDASPTVSMPASRPAPPVVAQPEAPADFDFEMSSIWDETGGAGEETPPATAAGAPKKRRRRRPRKSAGQKVEAGREQSLDQTPSEPAPATPRPAAPRPVPPRPAAPRPAEPRPAAAGSAEPRPAEPAPRPEPTPARESRSGRKTAPEPQAPPAKPRKKIFLE